jgi:dephospho-CoA kinase
VGPGHHELVSRLHGLRPAGDTIIETRPKPAFRVGLTGGIASGKSTVADFFADLGVPIIDTDVIAREVVVPGAPALDTIRDKFGDAVIDKHGGLDRAAMRRIVFADDARRAQLEAILHPLIRGIADQRANEASEPYVIIVVPLLFESPMRDAMDRILVVDCSPEVQLKRLLARDNESREQAERIIASQASREERLSIADDVIPNDGDLAKTRASVNDLHESYLEMAATRA